MRKVFVFQEQGLSKPFKAFDGLPGWLRISTFSMRLAIPSVSAAYFS